MRIRERWERDTEHTNRRVRLPAGYPMMTWSHTPSRPEDGVAETYTLRLGRDGRYLGSIHRPYPPEDPDRPGFDIDGQDIRMCSVRHSPIASTVIEHRALAPWIWVVSAHAKIALGRPTPVSLVRRRCQAIRLVEASAVQFLSQQRGTR